MDFNMVKAIALLSGGLDSILAVKLVQKQNIDVSGLTFTTPFFNAVKAQAAARQIDLPLMVEDITARTSANAQISALWLRQKHESLH